MLLKSTTITRTVWILSLVSLCTDMASEMLYPVMPIYLREIGFSVLLIAVLEGLAECVAGLSKAYFGQRSDALGRRLPFVQAGYALSAISKPMMALFTWPWWVFAARTTDRLGKGLRTAPRDALLAAEATVETRGSVFGFHRAMDTAGAVAGPALALLFLYFHPGEYRLLFFLAFIPGLLAIVATWWLKEKKMPVAQTARKAPLFGFVRYLHTADARYKKLLWVLLAFALVNSSDVFLLMRARDCGLGETAVIGCYIFYNLVYALAAWPLGRLADKLGMRKMMTAGLLLFAITYAGMGLWSSQWMPWLMFVFYGLYAAATEGVSKAWLSNLVPAGERGTALGTYNGLQSIAALLASSVAGVIWWQWGAGVMFVFTTLAVLIVSGLIFRLKF